MSATLTVASFNIRNGIAWDGLHSWPFRRRATAQTAARLAADLFGLQEAYRFQERYLLRFLDGYAATGAGRNAGGGGERCSVVYRQTRLRLEASRTRWLSDTPDVAGSRTWGNPLPRVATFCRFVDEESGRRFGFVNLHLDGASAASRERAAEALVSWLEPDLPWLVAGDLNEPPGGRAVRRLVAAGLRDLIAEKPDAAAIATEHGFGKTTRGRRIDYVLASKQWRLGRAWVAKERVGARLPSDHWPVAARLSLP